MGSQETKLLSTVNFSRADRVYFSNETISGTLRIESPKLMHVSGIYLVLKCKANYLKVVNDMALRRKREMSYIMEVHQQKTVICQDIHIPKGEKDYDFQLTIPLDLPPTLHHSNSTHITHHIYAIVCVANSICRPIRLCRHHLTILPSIRPMDNNSWLTATSDLLSHIDFDATEADQSVRISKQTVSDNDKLKCTLHLPVFQYSIRQAIPYTVSLQYSGNNNFETENGEGVEGEGRRLRSITRLDKEIQLDIRLIQYVIIQNNMYQRTVLKDLQKINMILLHDKAASTAESNGMFTLIRSNTPPSYCSKRHAIEIAYALSCVASTMEASNREVVVESTIPVYIHNEEISHVHYSKC